jgi:hypothetical protein
MHVDDVALKCNGVKPGETDRGIVWVTTGKESTQRKSSWFLGNKEQWSNHNSYGALSNHILKNRLVRVPAGKYGDIRV